MGKYSTSRTRSKRETDELEKAYQGMAGKKRQSKKKQKSHRKAGIVVICIALIAIVLGLAAGYIYLSDVAMNGVILENVYVAGVDVGGMTQQEAIEAVGIATENTYSKTPMVVTVLESKAEIPTSCVGALDVRGAVRAAYKFGNTGSQSKRQEEQNIAMTTGHIVDITPYLKLDSQRIQDILFELGGNYSTTLSQSTYEVTGEAPNQTLVVKLGVPEYGLDLDLLYKQVVDSYNRNIFKTTGTCGILEPAPIDLQKILTSHYIAPVDAYFDANTHEIVPGKDGYGFDLEDAQTKLNHASYGSTVEIPFGTITPTVTAESLKKMLFRDELATYTASALSDRDRDTNLELACKAIDGMILYPGDMFSYNNALGERTAAKGYKPGPSFSGNETVYTIGGGICQVSSALYYCAMVADLEILVRTNHGFAPSYSPLGMDATVSWGSLDFRFRNNTPYPIRIEASASGGDTTVRLLGTDDRDYYVKMETEIVSTDAHKISYQSMPADNAEGYRDGQYIVEPYTGYEIKVYRCKYSKAEDKLLSRELETDSVYRRRDGVICKIDSNAAPDIQPDMPGSGGVITEDGELPPE